MRGFVYAGLGIVGFCIAISAAEKRQVEFDTINVTRVEIRRTLEKVGDIYVEKETKLVHTSNGETFYPSNNVWSKVSDGVECDVRIIGWKLVGRTITEATCY